jgi:nucleoside transporter
VQKNHWWREYTELATLLGMWMVPLGSVLDANGFSDLKGLAFATSGISAFISPLIFGALADQRVSPVKILRWLGLATAFAMALAATAIGHHASKWVVLACIQLHSLCSAPTWGISTTIVLSRLGDAKREFGPLRAMGTVGWMVGCWIVSLIHADGTAWAGYCGAIIWVVVSAFTTTLPSVPPPATPATLAWFQRLGLDAIGLLKNKDHRVVFIASALFNIPLCAFYPYSPTHLKDLGCHATTAWMTFGQVTEIIAMFGLARLLGRWRLKTVFLAGMGFGILRYAVCAFDTLPGLLTGIALHGFAFTLFFITMQIYLEQRIDPQWRARAQALFALMQTGIGNTIGYLACHAWKDANTVGTYTRWPAFWGGLSLCVAVIWCWFALAYKGQKGQAGAV